MGAAVDRAWSVTTGSPQVRIAVLGAPGPLDDAALSTRWALNVGELPPPQGDAGYDRDGDGRISVSDYAGDSRVHDGNGNGFIDCDDLLAPFGNSTDDDGDGLADDLCGWDFARASAHALTADAGVDDFEQLAAPANDAIGGAGVCPDCAIEAVRVDPTARQLTLALKALTGRAQVVVLPPIAGVSGELAQAVGDAFDAGTLVIASGANVSTLETEQPAALPAMLSVGMLGPDSSDWTQAHTFLLAGSCSGHGPHLRAGVASDRCASGAAMMAAGIAGLAFSAALERGHPLDATRLRSWMTRPDLDARALVDLAAAGDLGPLPRVTAPAMYQCVSAGGFPIGATDTPSVSVCLFGFDAGCIEHPLSNGAADAGPYPVGGILGAAPYAQLLRIEPTGGIGERTLAFAVDDSSQFLGFPMAIPGAGASPPRLVDLDGDGSDELIVAGVDGRIHALLPSGEEATGFPLDAGGTIEQPLAFGDLLGIGHVGLVAVTREGQVHAFTGYGAELTGFPVDAGAELAAPVAVSSPVGELIVVGDALGRLHVLTNTGAEYKNAPLALDTSLPHPMAASDLDADGWPEVLIPFETQSFFLTIGPSKIATHAGWPIPATAGNALFADIDRDGTSELVLDQIYDTGGTALLSPVTPVKPRYNYVTDLNGDGVLDWYVVEDGAPGVVHRFRASSALGMSQGRISDATGWPFQLFDAAAPGVVAQAGGSSWQLLLPDTADAIWAIDFGGGGHASQFWPLPNPGSPVGSAVGLTQERLVLATVTRTGFVTLERLAGVSDTIRWDGFQRDRGNTGALLTPLPARHQPGIGVPLPPIKSEGCHCGVPGVGDPLFLFAMLLMLIRRRRP
ncbi:MAG: hypothetical protein QM723_36235 [Myxococcaceae bacterium]